MKNVLLDVEPAQVFRVVGFSGVERLGEKSTFTLDLVGLKEEPIDPSSMLGNPATFTLEGYGDTGRRSISGVVTRFAIAAKDLRNDHDTYRYKMTLESRFALFELRRRSRVFQDKTVPEIVEEVIKDSGYALVAQRLHGAYEKRPYVTQYNESDADFVRRLCEDAGLFFSVRLVPGWRAVLPRRHFGKKSAPSLFLAAQNNCGHSTRRDNSSRLRSENDEGKKIRQGCSPRLQS